MDKLLALTLPGGAAIAPPKNVPNGGLDYLGKVLSNGLTMFMTVGIILCLIFIVWSGVQWATSSGDKNKLASARGRITWAIVGLVIILLVFFILNVVGKLFGVKL